MSELLIRSDNVEALNKLADLVRFFGLDVEMLNGNPSTNTHLQHLPITFAQKPNVLALAGIWKNKKIKLDQALNIQEDLRQKAWGNRI